MRLEGKVALVTGAGAGIGRAVALAFAKQGAKVVLADNNPIAADAVVDEICQGGGTAVRAVGDVSDSQDARQFVQTAIEAFGHLDILVNNAGIYVQGDALATPEGDWDRLMAVNLRGVFLCSKFALAEMVRKGGGTIVNIASEAGMVGIAGQVAYNASKAAVLSMTRSMAVDHAAQGIRVNAVSPGTTFTPLVEAAISRAKDPDQARRKLEAVRPLNRLGRPEEIAAAVVFLASDDCAYATGSNVVVDGGFTAQ